MSSAYDKEMESTLPVVKTTEDLKAENVAEEVLARERQGTGKLAPPKDMLEALRAHQDDSLDVKKVQAVVAPMEAPKEEEAAIAVRDAQPGSFES